MAREILLTRDWVTPHYNFVPRLDKPIFFYWMVALSYKLFRVSEWSARLPSALAASGTTLLVFLWGRKFFGLWRALWSGLILITSVGFFALSRIVIFDMTLTFFITLSLCSFYWGQRTNGRARRKVLHLLMYAAMGAATLVKGPIGLILPGMVILFYLFFARKWFLLREIDLHLGVPLFLLMVARGSCGRQKVARDPDPSIRKLSAGVCYP
ncbi:MAG: ArnT family glycosyltransferase [Candidatus Binatia bacterium]